MKDTVGNWTFELINRLEEWSKRARLRVNLPVCAHTDIVYIQSIITLHKDVLLLYYVIWGSIRFYGSVTQTMIFSSYNSVVGRRVRS